MIDIPCIQAKKTSSKDVQLDKEGFFVIEIVDQKIRIEYYSNVYKKGKIVSGKLKTIFVGTQADALCDTIARHAPSLIPEHYLYLGRELQRAEEALNSGKKYVQDGC
jgi:dihydropteroate synthase